MLGTVLDPRYKPFLYILVVTISLVGILYLSTLISFKVHLSPSMK